MLGQFVEFPENGFVVPLFYRFHARHVQLARYGAGGENDVRRGQFITVDGHFFLTRQRRRSYDGIGTEFFSKILGRFVLPDDVLPGVDVVHHLPEVRLTFRLQAESLRLFPAGEQTGYVQQCLTRYAAVVKAVTTEVLRLLVDQRNAQTDGRTETGAAEAAGAGADYDEVVGIVHLKFLIRIAKLPARPLPCGAGRRWLPARCRN